MATLTAWLVRPLSKIYSNQGRGSQWIGLIVRFISRTLNLVQDIIDLALRPLGNALTWSVGSPMIALVFFLALNNASSIVPLTVSLFMSPPAWVHYCSLEWGNGNPSSDPVKADAAY